MEAGTAEPGPWHAWRRACLLIWLCSPQGRERGGGFALESRCSLPQASDHSGRLCPPLGIGGTLTQKQRWGLPEERSPRFWPSVCSHLLFPVSLAFSSESTSLLFLQSWGPTLANTLSCSSCSAGRWVTIARLGQLAKVPLTGVIAGWLLVLGAGPLRGAVKGWTSGSRSLWISLERGLKQRLVTCQHAWHPRCMQELAARVSFSLCFCRMVLEAAVLVWGL